MADRSILGLFQEAEPAADAMDGLAQAGFETGTFDVLTGTPYPEGAFGEHVPQHRLFRFPAFGAIVGFTTAVFLTAATQIAFPLVTGGKPILSLFAMLIIMYEMTMLSAVIATVNSAARMRGRHCRSCTSFRPPSRRIRRNGARRSTGRWSCRTSAGRCISRR